MPTYTTICEGCKVTREIRLTFAEYEDVCKGFKELECVDCQGKVSLQFNPGAVSFVLKDGESGGWASKALKENKYRAIRRRVMARREKDHVFKSRLIPNYMGQETGTWKDAQEEARKDGGNIAASTYDPLVKGRI